MDYYFTQLQGLVITTAPAIAIVAIIVVANHSSSLDDPVTTAMIGVHIRIL